MHEDIFPDIGLKCWKLVFAYFILICLREGLAHIPAHTFPM